MVEPVRPSPEQDPAGEILGGRIPQLGRRILEQHQVRAQAIGAERRRPGHDRPAPLARQPHLKGGPAALGVLAREQPLAGLPDGGARARRQLGLQRLAARRIERHPQRRDHHRDVVAVGRRGVLLLPGPAALVLAGDQPLHRPLDAGIPRRHARLEQRAQEEGRGWNDGNRVTQRAPPSR
jgi:hypothetical protein